MGCVLLESGHAYRTTHLQHHRLFPSDDDPEGYPANLSLLGAIFYGPIFLPRLWLWAFRRNRGRRGQRAWLIAEALVPPLVIAAGVLLWPITPALLLYAALAIAGSWVYPLLTVYLPHKDYGETPLTQTHTLRGRLIPALFLELTYHLEHHLYPQVPSHHLAQLADRLDPLGLGADTWAVIVLALVAVVSVFLAVVGRGRLAVTATGIPTDLSQPAERVEATFRVAESDLPAIASALSSLEIEDVVLEGNEVRFRSALDVLGIPLEFAVGLRPEAVDGALAFTPSTLSLNGDELDLEEFAGQFGGILGDGVLATQTVCVAESLPRDLMLEGVTVEGDELVVRLGADDAVLEGNGFTERGTCPAS